jgi:hypothetical protein
MMTEPPDRIDRAIEINAPPERVWRALTDSAELSAWFKVEIEGDIAAGNELWFTSTMPGYEGHRVPVRIVELTPPRQKSARGTRLSVSVSETGFEARRWRALPCSSRRGAIRPG